MADPSHLLDPSVILHHPAEEVGEVEFYAAWGGVVHGIIVRCGASFEMNPYNFVYLATVQGISFTNEQSKLFQEEIADVQRVVGTFQVS